MVDKQPISRKYKVSIYALILATLAYLATALHPALAAAYSTFVMALGAIAGLYHSGNVAADHVQAKVTKNIKTDPGAP